MSLGIMSRGSSALGMLRVFLAFILGGCVAWQPAAAQPPDLLKTYRFLPRMSTLHQTGGFAGFDIEFPVLGTFDFVTGYSSAGFPLPTLERYASFTNVDAWAPHPVLDYVLLIDQTLNLSELEGAPVYSDPEGLEVFRFRGREEQGEPFALDVATVGRWLFLRGSNDPQCCDLFQYDIQAVAHQVPYADRDADGRVDATDLGMWSAGYRAGHTGYDGREFLDWQRAFGEEPPTVAEFDTLLTTALAANGTSLFAVPEPNTGALLLVLALLLDRPPRCRY